MPLPFRRASVGSTNPAKVEAVRRSLARLAPECALEAVDVPSGVGAMPPGAEATREGALARARGALELTTAAIAFGLDGGAILDRHQAWLTAHVAPVAHDCRTCESAL